MNRRAATRAALGPLVALVIAMTAALGHATPAAALPSAGPAIPAQATAPAPEPPPTPITVNEFLPDDANISDCLGALERPGCGSKERGGWRQSLVFVAMAAGLVVVFGRIALGVYRNRS